MTLNTEKLPHPEVTIGSPELRVVGWCNGVGLSTGVFY